MKTFFYKSILCFLIGCSCISQAQHQNYIVLDQADTLTFKTQEKVYQYIDSLQSIGYYTIEIDSVSSVNQTTTYKTQRGKFYRKYKFTLDSLSQNIIPEVYLFNPEKVDSLMQYIHQKYKEKGYPLNDVQLNSSIKGDSMVFDIQVDLESKRRLDAIKMLGYTHFNKGYQKYIQQKWVGKTFTPTLLQELQEHFQQQTYLKSLKEPQLLFTQDSTYLYLYLEKVKNSYVDGVLGFGNDQNDEFRITGSIDLHLQNVFNQFENIQLKWNSTPDTSQNLDVAVSIPYIFKTRIAWDSHINIFRQDSTFIVFEAHQKFLYALDLQQQLGVSGRYMTSNFLGDSLLSNGRDFKKSGLGVLYQYQKSSSNRLMTSQKGISFSMSFLQNRPENNSSLRQYELGLLAYTLIPIGGNSHYLFPKIEMYSLLSDIYQSNELQRFGGFNSLRGFNQQSIYANTFIFPSLEYRYQPLESFYLNAFWDVAYVENDPSDSKEWLQGIGAGINFGSSFGIFSLQYAVGKFENTPFSFNQSRIHFGVKATF